MTSRAEGAFRRPCDLVAGELERLGRALGQRVDAAVHVRVRRLVELGHRVEHLARFLRARGRVEEGERLAVERLLEDGKVRPQAVRVELPVGGHGHRGIVPLAVWVTD